MSLSSNFRELALPLTIIAGVGGLVVTGVSFGAARMGLNPLFTSATSAQETVKANGLEPIEVGGYGWLSCSNGEQGDLWRTKFTAKNIKGETVKGVICEGFFKGGTLRGLEIVK